MPLTEPDTCGFPTSGSTVQLTLQIPRRSYALFSVSIADNAQDIL